jgi:hypothetical protein
MRAPILVVRSIADYTSETSRVVLIQITGIDLRGGGKIIGYFGKFHCKFLREIEQGNIPEY